MSEESKENKEKEKMDKVVDKNKDLNDNIEEIKDNDKRKVLSRKA